MEIQANSRGDARSYKMENSRGDVRCSKLPFPRGKKTVTGPNGVSSYNWPVLQGYSNVNVCSSGTAYKSLSPMLTGPFYLKERKVKNNYYPDGIHPGFMDYREFLRLSGKEISNGEGDSFQRDDGFQRDDDFQVAYVTNIENFYQGSKCFNIDIEGKVIKRSFFERRAKLFVDPKAHRRAIPKKSGYPICSSIDGHILPYVASRIFYIDYYERLTLMNPKYQELKKRVDNGENINILGYDGRDPETDQDFGVNFITYKNLEKQLYDPTNPFGHELVLAGMLLNIRPWENFDLERALSS